MPLSGVRGGSNLSPLGPGRSPLSKTTELSASRDRGHRLGFHRMLASHRRPHCPRWKAASVVTADLRVTW